MSSTLQSLWRSALANLRPASSRLYPSWVTDSKRTCGVKKPSEFDIRCDGTARLASKISVVRNVPIWKCVSGALIIEAPSDLTCGSSNLRQKIFKNVGNEELELECSLTKKVAPTDSVITLGYKSQACFICHSVLPSKASSQAVSATYTKVVLYIYIQL